MFYDRRNSLTDDNMQASLYLRFNKQHFHPSHVVYIMRQSTPIEASEVVEDSNDEDYDFYGEDPITLSYKEDDEV